MTDTSYTETFDVWIDGTELLALPHELDQRVDEALHGEDRDKSEEIREEISTAITEKIQQYGVNATTGEWYGEWSAETIVRDILARHAD